MNPSFWDDRYSADAYVYGTESNAFLAAHAHRIPPGPVLCLAEGEGRNAVFLAARGHAVTAVDQSPVGLAKAEALARSRGVTLKTVVADLGTFPIEPASWSGIVSIWAHLPRPLRRDLHTRCLAGLRTGGVFILEAYTPDQLNHGTGGPRDAALLMTLEALREELAGLEWVVAREIEREVREGSGHAGPSAVVQVVARRP